MQQSFRPIFGQIFTSVESLSRRQDVGLAYAVDPQPLLGVQPQYPSPLDVPLRDVVGHVVVHGLVGAEPVPLGPLLDRLVPEGVLPETGQTLWLPMPGIRDGNCACITG